MNGKYEHHIYKLPQLPFVYGPCCEESRMGFSTYHWHEHLEMLIFHNDAAGVRISGETYSPKAGDMILVNPNELHDVADRTGMSHECLIVDASFLKENGFEPESIRLRPWIQQDSQALRLAGEVTNCFQSDVTLKVPHIRSAVLNLMVYLYDNYCLSECILESDPAADSIKKAIRYLRSCYAQRISLDDAAMVAGLSRYYFSRKFHEVTGQSFVAYLNSVRCEKATPLLLRGMSVTEVSYSCGFDGVGQFSRTYRSIVGRTPSSVRPHA